MKVYVAMMEQRDYCFTNDKCTFNSKCLGVGVSRKIAWSLCGASKAFFLCAYNEYVKETRDQKNADLEQRTVKTSNGKCEVVKLGMKDGFVSYFFWVESCELKSVMLPMPRLMCYNINQQSTQKNKQGAECHTSEQQKQLPNCRRQEAGRRRAASTIEAADQPDRKKTRRRRSCPRAR